FGICAAAAFSGLLQLTHFDFSTQQYLPLCLVRWLNYVAEKWPFAGSVFRAELPNLCASFGFVVVDKIIQIIYSG
ncbi:MAG: hypothetical protein GY905_09655, partial [Gammaproteobacteria bacterium]|nr:hypothetical protein [Gammaproteobacteria bacterium]